MNNEIEKIKEILEIFKQVDLEQEVGGCYNCPKKDKDKICIGCLNNAKDKLLDYITNLQARIDKAIEYIEELDDNENSYGDYDIHYQVKKELLDILKGSDKE